MITHHITTINYFLLYKKLFLKNWSSFPKHLNRNSNNITGIISCIQLKSVEDNTQTYLMSLFSWELNFIDLTLKAAAPECQSSRCNDKCGNRVWTSATAASFPLFSIHTLVCVAKCAKGLTWRCTAAANKTADHRHSFPRTIVSQWR